MHNLKQNPATFFGCYSSTLEHLKKKIVNRFFFTLVTPSVQQGLGMKFYLNETFLVKNIY